MFLSHVHKVQSFVTCPKSTQAIRPWRQHLLLNKLLFYQRAQVAFGILFAFLATSLLSMKYSSVVYFFRRLPGFALRRAYRHILQDGDIAVGGTPQKVVVGVAYLSRFAVEVGKVAACPSKADMSGVAVVREKPTCISLSL